MNKCPNRNLWLLLGSCGVASGAFHGCYNVIGSIDEVIPVNAYIPGCPPRPEAIIDGVVKLVNSIRVQE